MSNEKINGYDLTRNWFNFCFENPEKINPSHTAIYCFAIEHCNRLGWKDKFGFPTMMVCDALGIKKASTYIKYFNDLALWGFIEVVERSTNQYSANIICLSSAKPKKGEALDKAILNHRDKQTVSIGISKVPIDKQLTTKQPTTKPIDDIILYPSFEDFWNMYDKKSGNKSKCEKNWNKHIHSVKEKIINHVEDYVKSTPDKQYRKNPETYLNQSHWENEILNNLNNSKDENRKQVSNLASQIIDQYPNL